MDEPSTQSRRKPQKIRYLEPEWDRVVARARACGLPPATFVRKVSLGVKLRVRRNRTADALIVELGRIGMELRRLAQMAERAGEGPAREEIAGVLDQVLTTIRRVG